MRVGGGEVRRLGSTGDRGFGDGRLGGGWGGDGSDMGLGAQ